MRAIGKSFYCFIWVFNRLFELGSSYSFARARTMQCFDKISHDFVLATQRCS